MWMYACTVLICVHGANAHCTIVHVHGADVASTTLMCMRTPCTVSVHGAEVHLHGSDVHVCTHTVHGAEVHVHGADVCVNWSASGGTVPLLDGQRETLTALFRSNEPLTISPGLKALAKNTLHIFQSKKATNSKQSS